MTRVPNTNYQATTSTQFQIATDDNDPYDRELDTSRVATALDEHTHGVGRGAPVTRVAANAVDTAALQNGAVTEDKMATNSVGSNAIKQNAVGADEIVDGGVGTAEIADDAVTLGKLAHGTASRVFATDASGVPVISQLVAAMFPNLIISTAMIADLAVTGAKMANGTVTATQIADATITGAKIATNTIPGDSKLQPSTVSGNSGASAIGTDCLHANRLSTGSFSKAEFDRFSGAATKNIGIEHIYENSGSRGAGKVLGDDGTGFSWISLSSGVTMTGIVAAVRNAASIPSGWVRESGLDGRMMVFDGTVFSTTWTAENNYGASWSHAHGPGNLQGTATTTTGAAQNGGAYDEDETGNIHNTRDAAHDHPVSISMTLSGGQSESVAWTIPCRAYVPVYKS